MGRFSMNEADNYGGQGGGGFLTLKNDKDIVSVRFLYNSIDDIEGLAVHEVQVNGKKRYVNCLRDYNEPKDKCPFCREEVPLRAKAFIPVYNVDQDQVQIWERGKTIFAKLSSVFSRYGKHPIVAQEFEIERNGKPNSTDTTYEIYRTETPADDAKVEDFDEVKILGGLVMDKTAQEMEEYLETGSFAPNETNNNEEVSSRVSRRTERRTPSRANREDSF